MARQLYAYSILKRFTKSALFIYISKQIRCIKIYTTNYFDKQI